MQTENFCGPLAGAGKALWFYLGKAVLPMNLNMIYPRWQIDSAAPIAYVPVLFGAPPRVVLVHFGGAGDGPRFSGWVATP